MLKTKKSKQNVTILVLSVMLAIAAIFGVTAAWFVSSAEASGTVGTGSVTVELYQGKNKLTGTGAFTATNVVAKGNVLDKPIDVKVTAKGTDVYLRASIVVTVAGENPGIAASDFTINTVAGWTKNGNYYYYTGATQVGDTTATTVKEVKDGTTQGLCDGIILAETSNAQGKTGVTVTIHVDAVQAANQAASKAFNDIAWNND